MTTLATTSSLRDALTPEALTRARRRLLTAHPDPTRANTPTPGSLTDEQLRLLAASDWVPPRIAALGANTIALHLCNANKRTGMSTFEWAPDFAPSSASELAKGLHALTWNDRPLDQWA